MRRILFMFMLVLVSTIASAQTMQEVVYLKNGSVIRGIIIEQVPNESLKVQTADGSIFAYKMEEVERITKEMVGRSGRSTNISTIGGKNRGGREKGYRGFADFGGGLGVGDWGDGRVGFSTSHGYQVCPYFFIGAGIGFNYHFDWEAIMLPMFVHVRSEFLDYFISPFFDLKIGYSPVVDSNGFYMEPSVGCRFGVGRRAGLSIGVGYEMQMLQTEWYYKGWYDETNICGAVTFKLAVDF